MRDRDLEHLVITNLLRTGEPDGREPKSPRCPVCGSECETIYKDAFHQIFTCEVCVIATDAWEQDDCFPS